MPGSHMALATKPTVVAMSRPSLVALLALVTPIASHDSVLATALAANFVGCLRAHRFDSASALRPASVIFTRAIMTYFRLHDLANPAIAALRVAACRPYAPLRSKLDTTHAPSSPSARVINGGSST
jgi:hypothetical protein